MEELLKYIVDENLKVSLDMIQIAVKKIWANDAPRIVQDYTDHGFPHCERLAKSAHLLLNINNGQPLSEQEMYLLLAGIYLHDIGMQCDVIKFPMIKVGAEKYGANFSIEFTAQTSNTYSLNEQKAVRDNHHYLTAAWIDYAYTSGETLLGQAARTINEDLVDDLIDICIYHTKLAITDCPYEHKVLIGQGVV